jgi:hypothetical protein
MREMVGRADRRMVGATLFLAVLCISATVRLSAQVTFQTAAGVRYTSTMVHDSIVTGVDVRPRLAPALSVTATTPIQHGWAVEGIADLSWSTLQRHDEGGPTVDLGGLTTLAVEVGVRHPLVTGLSGRLAVGGLKYFPGNETGIFRDGSGGILPLGGVAVSYVPPAGIAQRWGLGIEARYDLHAFITPALRNRGFTSSRPVHRVALAVRAAWPHAGGQP